MATNLNLDPSLIEQARQAGHHRTKRAAVEAALREYIRKRACQAVTEAFGTFEFDPDYDYKRARTGR